MNPNLVGSGLSRAINMQGKSKVGLHKMVMPLRTKIDDITVHSSASFDDLWSVAGITSTTHQPSLSTVILHLKHGLALPKHQDPISFSIPITHLFYSLENMRLPHPHHKEILRNMPDRAQHPNASPASISRREPTKGLYPRSKLWW